MIEINRKYQTQWAAQFFVSAELTRRGYMVALTLGNMPSVDLNVVSPGGKQFMVDVKGQRTKNFWRFRRKEPHRNHYYIFAYVPEDITQDPRYFILSSRETMKKRDEYKIKGEARGKYHDSQGGMNWTTPHQYEDNWKILPK